ncbi:MAG TPA: hypothetical protein PLU27_11660 [Ginsengibacter sp.]|nr:hypothetical protein [Ginsengibacter sp.]
MKLLIVVTSLFCFSSCNMPKNIIKDKEMSISLTTTECGSYGVRNHGDLIGYVVKPFYVEVEDKEKYIIRFENLIKANHSNYYDRFYRTYWFSRNSVSDTLILVEMLSSKDVNLISNWQCEVQEVEVYNQLYGYKNSSKPPRSFIYNCSKNRFKILGDPD